MNDSHGRSVSVSMVNGHDIYTVGGISISVPAGTDSARTLWTIDAMIPYVAPSAPTIFAPYDFIALFTDAEFGAITNCEDLLVRKAVAKVYSITTFVDLQDPETIQLMQYMTYLGLITLERAGQILAGVSHGG